MITSPDWFWHIYYAFRNRGDFEFYATPVSPSLRPGRFDVLSSSVVKSGRDGKRGGTGVVEVQLISRGVKREREGLIRRGGRVKGGIGEGIGTQSRGVAGIVVTDPSYLSLSARGIKFARRQHRAATREDSFESVNIPVTQRFGFQLNATPLMVAIASHRDRF